MSKPASTEVIRTDDFLSRMEERRRPLGAGGHQGPISPLAEMDVAAEAQPFDLEWWLRTTPFREVDVEFDTSAKVVWQFMKFRCRPSVTLELLSEIKKIQGMIGHALRQPGADADPPVRYVVLASHLPGVFNMGGDLPLFVDLIRKGDPEGLRHYAHACVDVQYLRWTKRDLPIQTISLVQGDALGGGFEAALADDVIIAEESAKFALPEILFNLFPGMGAYSFLARRIDMAATERLMLSGKIYSAAELHEMGVVDQVVGDGCGNEAVYDYVSRSDRSFAARNAVLGARRKINPLTREELIDITDRWVEAALTLAPLDLRKMERLAAAQDRRRSRARTGD